MRPKDFAVPSGSVATLRRLFVIIAGPVHLLKDSIP